MMKRKGGVSGVTYIYLCVVINVLKSVKSDGAAFLME